MLESRLENRLKSLLKQKAIALNLPHKGIEIIPLNPLKDNLISIGAEMYIDMKDGIIILETGNMPSVSDNELELMVEHEICHCKDDQEVVYGSEVFVPVHSAQILAMEMYQSYIEYFACQRQIREFGMERFIRFQMRGLEDFIIRVERYFGKATDYKDKTGLIAAFYKEQIKCNLMEGEPLVIPSVVMDLVAPFPESFEKIHNSGLKWIDKSKLLYLMLTIHFGNIDIVRSYINSRLILQRDLKDGTSKKFLDKGVIGNEIYFVGKEIEQSMLRKYLEILK